MPQQKGTGGGAAGRYVLRHIFRAPGKSLLCLALAVVFMAGLMLIRVSAIRSENELERLYTTTTVTVELTRSNNWSIGGFIYPSTVEKLTETGFLSHRYVEAAEKEVTLTRLDSQGKERGFGQYSIGNATLYGIEYPQEFLAQKGVEGELTYFEGWGEAVFLQSWQDWQSAGAARVYPAVVSQALYDSFQMKDGYLLRVEITISDPMSSVTYFTSVTVVGTHPGDLSTVLLPVESLRNVSGVEMKYDRVILTVDPAKNRQLDEFRTQAARILSVNGTVPITAIWGDQELRQAIAPVEQTISLMKALYPVTLVLSLIVAAGISVLFSLLSAREAAILRVLGNSKARCRAILCLQTILVCLAGLVLGHLGAVGMAYAMLSPEDAAGLLLPALGRVGLYLLAAVVGAAGVSVAMTAKNPLELLQVKE